MKLKNQKNPKNLTPSVTPIGTGATPNQYLEASLNLIQEHTDLRYNHGVISRAIATLETSNSPMLRDIKHGNEVLDNKNKLSYGRIIKGHCYDIETNTKTVSKKVTRGTIINLISNTPETLSPSDMAERRAKREVVNELYRLKEENEKMAKTLGTAKVKVVMTPKVKIPSEDIRVIPKAKPVVMLMDEEEGTVTTLDINVDTNETTPRTNIDSIVIRLLCLGAKTLNATRSTDLDMTKGFFDSFDTDFILSMFRVGGIKI